MAISSFWFAEKAQSDESMKILAQSRPAVGDAELGVIRVMRVADIADVLPGLEEWTCWRCGTPGSSATFGGFVIRDGMPVVFCNRSDCVEAMTAGESYGARGDDDAPV